MRISLLASLLCIACGRVAFDDTRMQRADAARADASDARDARDSRPVGVPTFVQGAVIQNTQNPQSLAYAGAVTTGDLIVVAVGALSAPSAIADTQGNAYAMVVDIDNPNDGSFGQVWYAVAAGGSDTVTVSYANATTHTIELLEYAHAGVWDSVSTDSGSGTMLDSGGTPTSVDGDLVLAFTHQPTATTWTPAATFTVREDNQHTLVADELAGSAGAYHATLTSAKAQPWDVAAVAFQPAP